MKLGEDFYQGKNVVRIAQALLGKALFTNLQGVVTGGIIVETEAYSWKERGCHAFDARKTARNAIMFEKGGHAYVYLCYGMHHLFNVVTNKQGTADAVLIPLQCEYYALEGLTQLLATIDLVRDHLNPRLAIEGVVLTMADGRTNLSADVATEARRHLGRLVFDTVIPRSVRLSEAPSHGLPIGRYAQESRGARAYADLAAEFLARHAPDGGPGDAAAAVEPEVAVLA